MNSRSRHRKLILFDLDGTLVNVGKQHREGFYVALRTIYGLDIGEEHDRRGHQGNTQPNIMRIICRSKGLSSEVIEARLAEAMMAQSQATIALLPQDLHTALLPGVADLLEALQRDGHALGLVTGTVSATTRVILERTGLRRHFPVCACGDEGSERVDLLHLAISRAACIYGLEPGPDNLVVIGDAPRDIQAGQAVGARVVAVATGQYTSDVLAQYHPDAILPNLANTPAALEAIVGMRE